MPQREEVPVRGLPCAGRRGRRHGWQQPGRWWWALYGALAPPPCTGRVCPHPGLGGTSPPPSAECPLCPCRQQRGWGTHPVPGRSRTNDRPPWAGSSPAPRWQGEAGARSGKSSRAQAEELPSPVLSRTVPLPSPCLVLSHVWGSPGTPSARGCSWLLCSCSASAPAASQHQQPLFCRGIPTQMERGTAHREPSQPCLPHVATREGWG